jgi:hypothetical protein
MLPFRWRFGAVIQVVKEDADDAASLVMRPAPRRKSGRVVLQPEIDFAADLLQIAQSAVFDTNFGCRRRDSPRHGLCRQTPWTSIPNLQKLRQRGNLKRWRDGLQANGLW